MKIRRFRIPPSAIRGHEAVVSGDAARHMRDVLRLKLEMPVVLFDGEGREWAGQIKRVSKREVVVELSGSTFVAPEDEGARVLLLVSLARGSHTDLTIQKATELGVAEIRLFVSERTVAVPRPGGDPVRIDRLERIATDAARQSGRARVPPVLPPEPWLEALEQLPEGSARVLAWTGEHTRPMAEVLEAWDRATPLVVAIGPEGGFTDEEVDDARAQGFATAHLGPFILRTETAAISAVALARLTGARVDRPEGVV